MLKVLAEPYPIRAATSPSATLAPMPLVAVYTASKTAIEGFTASLAFELQAFDALALALRH